MKRCSVEWCTNIFVAKWMCKSHYMKLKRRWTTDSFIKEVKYCTVCWEKATSIWFCTKHYKIHYNSIKVKSICTVKDCNSFVMARKLCSKHLSRLMRYWNIDYVQRIRDGFSNENKMLQSVYYNMKDRCFNNKNKYYYNYWWRWITVDNRWLWLQWFRTFVDDMRDRPEWYTIDRIDNNGNYCKENCRRASMADQQSNRRNNNKVVWVSKHKSWWYVASIKRWWKYIINKYFTFEQDAIKTAEEVYKQLRTNTAKK